MNERIHLPSVIAFIAKNPEPHGTEKAKLCSGWRLDCGVFGTKNVRISSTKMKYTQQ